jgi:hypothetical protein
MPVMSPLKGPFLQPEVVALKGGVFVAASSFVAARCLRADDAGKNSQGSGEPG